MKTKLIAMFHTILDTVNGLLTGLKGTFSNTKSAVLFVVAIGIIIDVFKNGMFGFINYVLGTIRNLAEISGLWQVVILIAIIYFIKEKK